jgi:exopolysaccharide biosynthesis protein
MVDRNHFVMIVVDGRDPGYSRGATLNEFATMFLDAGATVAYNLDGGGSATMYFKGKVVNKPRNGSKVLTERKSSDMLYIGGATGAGGSAPGNGTTDPAVTTSPAFTG